MFKNGKRILYLLTIIFILSQAGKVCIAESVYNFTKDSQSTYKGEEIFIFKDNVSEEDFKSNERPCYPEVKEVIIEKGVTFFDWDYLTKGYFPNVEMVNISNTVKKINSSGYYFYNGLKKLKTIHVEEDNAYYTSDKGCLFNKNKTVLIQYPIAQNNTSYSIPDTVTTITGNAFINAENLKSVTLGAKVNANQIGSIREQLKDINAFTVNSRNSSFRAIDGVLFNKKGDSLLLYPNGKGTAYSVPKGTGTIEKYAFYQSKLEKITLPEGLKTIKDNAFTTCFHLTGITIPKSVTRMNILDFKYLDSLQSFHMESGSKLYVSYEGILYNTARTKIIFVPKAYKKTVLKFPSTLTGLNLSSFNLKDTTEIIIPKALKELETYTDSGKCFNKISIESGNKNFILYQGSLYNKNKTELYLFKKQEKAEFPDTLKNINIFYLRNSGIKEMIIPENAQIITWIDTVYDIPTLEKVSVVKDSKYYTLENGLLLSKDKTILYDIPRDIKELKIPDTVKSVNSSLTFRKTDLKSVSIPESAVDINYSDFMYLKSAVSIEADKNNNAFTSINGVLYNKDVTVLIYYPVNKTDKTYVMPDTVKYILNPESITDNPYLESITLSGALEYRDYGFVKSNSLKEINVDDSNAYYKSLEGVLYNKEMTVLVAYPFQKTDKTFIVPDTVMEVSGFCYSKDTMLDDYQYTVNAFSNPYLETLVIGKKVKTLFTVYDNYTIWDFKNLQKIEVSNDNPFFSSKDGILYNKEFTVMYLYPRDCRNEVLTIPGSVREIQDTFINAAVNNKYLKSISLVSDNKAFSTDGITLSNYAGNHIYLRIGDTNYGKRIFSD